MTGLTCTCASVDGYRITRADCPIHPMRPRRPAHEDPLRLTFTREELDDAVTAARAEVRGKIEALAKQMKPGLSIPPLDCTNACMDSDCDCSGDFRPVSWSGVTPDDLRALVADLGGDHA